MAVLEELERMSEERFLSIYEALAERGYGPLDGEVAKQLRFRPHAIQKLPIEKRARQARRILLGRRNAELAYDLFGSHLVKNRKELVTSFLDATGVEHEDGIIRDVDGARPDPEKIEAAVADLDSRFDREDVSLYLALAAEHWPVVDRIVELWRSR